MKILLVGDEARMRRLLSFGLAAAFDEPAAVSSLVELGRLPALRSYDAALLDWEMRTERALVMLSRLRCLSPSLPVIVLTSRPHQIEDARAAGACDALVKPVDIDAARQALGRVAPPREHSQTGPRPPFPASAPRPGVSASSIPTRSPLVSRQLAIAAKVAPTLASVLLLGENGTGKTRLARSIHDQSPRHARPFVTVNCPCLQAQLLESELFGHVRGAYTGAVSDTGGLVAAAEAGTLFLDEVGELPLSLQPKLLRLLQERSYERVGEARTRQADIRVIAATNRDLRADVAAGRFREDLYYRLNVIAIEMPALRQRSEDILPTADHLLIEFCKDAGRSLRGFSTEARIALQRHGWPGNLRELRNCIERAAILCEGDIVGLGDLPDLRADSSAPTPQVGDFVTLAALEEAHIRRVVERTGSFMQAAQLLGINKTTLYRRRRRSDDGTVPFEQGLRDALTA